MATRRRARIATVSVLGGKAKRGKTNQRRITWLKAIADALCVHADWAPLDAVLLPGGFFRLKHPIGEHAHEARAAAIQETTIGVECRRASVQLQQALGDVALIVGIDSAPLSRYVGGDQLIVAWRGGEIVGLARKIFPVSGDTDGEVEARLRCFASDYASPHRIIELGNGSRAVLCACYDLFALRALTIDAGGLRSLLGAIRFLHDLDGDMHEPPSAARRMQLFESWRSLVREAGVSVALAAIHGFEQPGRDSYWQRHGIASASAGLAGGLALGAAHFRTALPSPAASTLAAFGVRASHLMQGPHRRAHYHEPAASFLMDGNGRDEPAALVRLFEET